MKEIWKKIDGFDYYEVSNKGRIRSLDKEITHTKSNQYSTYTQTMIRRGCIRKPSDNGNGYLTVPLKHLGKQTMVYIHREVGKAFVPNPDNKPCINHKDGNKSNNNADNLEWCTQSENNQHAWDTGLCGAPEDRISRAKLTENEVLQIRSVYSQKWATQKEIADSYGIDDSTVCNIVNRKLWKHI